MATTTWPCPSCGQMQKLDHAAGEAVRIKLCASCEEKKAKHEADGDGA